MLVNRQCRPQDTQTLTVYLQNTTGRRQVEDVLASRMEGLASPQAYWLFEDGESTFQVTLAPGEGRLFRITDGLNGTLTENAYWSGDIVVNGDITVDAGVVLTIYEGTTAEFLQNTGLYVNGDITAQGSSPGEITFRQLSGQWDGLYISDGVVDITHVNISGAWEVWFKGVEGTIESSSLAPNGWTIAEDSPIQFLNCTFQTGTGIGLLTAAVPGSPRIGPTLKVCTFSDNAIGLASSNRSIVTVYDGNIFSGNGIAIQSDGGSEPWLFKWGLSLACEETNNEISGNGTGVLALQDANPFLGIYSEGLDGFEGRNRIYGNTVDIDNSTWSQDDIYAQVNHWVLSSACYSGIPGALNGPVIWEPTVSDLYGGIKPPKKDQAKAMEKEAQGQYTQAASIYQGLIDTSQTEGTAIWSLAGLVRCYEKLQSPDDLVSLLNTYSQAETGSPLVKYAQSYMVSQEIDLGNYTTAQTLAETILQDYPNSDVDPKLMYELALIAELQQPLGRIASGGELSATTLSPFVAAKYSEIANKYPETGYGMLAKAKAGVGREPESIQAALPDALYLHQNYPNPFNPTTTIRFDLPEVSYISLVIYDILGREVRTLLDNRDEAGFKSMVWDGKDNDGNIASAGIYIYMLRAWSQESEKSYSMTRKMILLR